MDAPTHDFGRVDNSQPFDHTFEIRNEGKSDLNILNVRSTCGCTAGQITATNIPPGGTSAIAARVNLRGRTGPQNLALILETNDPANRRARLQLRGEATADLEIRPRRVFFDQLTPGAPMERTVHIRYRGVGGMSIQGLEVDSPAFTAELVPMEEDSHYHLTVRYVGHSKGDDTSTLIRLKTDHARHLEIVVPVRSRAVENLIVAPSKFTLQPVPEGRSLTRYVVIRPGQGDRFEIRDVITPDPDINVRIHPMQPSGYRIQLTGIRPTDAMDGQHVRILTDMENKPEIDIPIEVVR